MTASFHRAEDADERGEGICRNCLAPIWNEGGTIGRSHRDTGWSDRIERGGDSLVCFKAVEYRHVPLARREACIYDHAYQIGASTSLAAIDRAYKDGYDTGKSHAAAETASALAAARVSDLECRGLRKQLMQGKGSE